MLILEGALGKEQQTKLKLKVSDCQITLGLKKVYFKFESRRGIGLVFCAEKVVIFEFGKGFNYGKKSGLNSGILLDFDVERFENY